MSAYAALLIFHSYYRWFVVALLLAQILWFIYHSYRHTVFEVSHLRLLLGSSVLYDIQFITGWFLYFQSTVAQQFWTNPATMVKLREIRFFGLEHMSMMSLAILLINILAWRSSKKTGEKAVFRNLLNWYALIVLIILGSIPWSFSPFTQRPDFR